MNTLKLIAIVMIVAGIQGLLYGGLYCTNASEDAPPKQAQEPGTTVAITNWAGLGAVTAGGALLLFGSRQRRKAPTDQSCGPCSR